ncbi:NAD(+) synthase [Oscillospiraceae bacterium PP1C4]
MKHGFVKVAAGTPDIRVADCIYNAESTIRIIEQAFQAGARLLVLPELGLTGYTCGDLFLQQTLLDGALEALKAVKSATAKLDMLVVVGLPVARGGKLYNCGAVLYNGSLLGLVPKTHVPNYNEFYEKRHFAAAPAENTTVHIDGQEVALGSKLLFECEELPDFVLGVEICEDVWAVCPPSVLHTTAGATVIANLSASDELVGKDSYRRNLVSSQSARLVCGYLYANAGEGESTTDLVFAAHNLIAENGTILAESNRFETGLTTSELDVHRLAGERRHLTTFPEPEEHGYQRILFSMPLRDTVLSRTVSPRPFIPSNPAARESCCEDVLRIQSYGLKKRISHTFAKTAVVGISGGLDSALALLVTVRAIDLLKRPRTDIVAITMPCFGTTARTKDNAELLSERLGVTLHRIDIKAAVDQHFLDIGQSPDSHDVTFENAQARERTQVLMDMANLTGGLVIGTGDLSELALGWATYNGDHMSMYGVNASVPKTLVRHLVAYEAEKASDARLREVLLDILDTPVSPELLPPKEGEIQQKTEDLVGPYELHDFFLYYAIRWAFPPAKVLRLAEYAFGGSYDRETILHWLNTFYRRFFNQQFKRSCLPDGPKIGSVSLSPRGDWRMPSDAVSALWLRQLESLL